MKIYNSILEKMQNKYTQLVGVNPDDASDIGIRLKVLAGELSALYASVEYIENQVFPQSSTGEYLNLHAEARGLVRKNATPATGSLRFSRSNPATVNLDIPIYTTVSTSGETSATYTTTQKSVLKAGDYFVDVPAKSLVAGGNSNAGAGKVQILVSPLPGITKVTNLLPFTGGGEKEDDDKLRQRLMYSYANASNGANAAYYYNMAVEHPDVSKAKVLPRHRGRGTVDLVIFSEDEGMEERVSGEIKSLCENHREIGVDLLVYGAQRIFTDISVEISVKEGHTPVLVIGACQEESKGYIDSLEIGETLKINHLGRVLLNTSGVENYRFITPIKDIPALSHQIHRSRNITVVLGEG